VELDGSTQKPLCVYCLSNEADTKDHVIAEGFFETAPEGGYVKVPACYACNNRLSRDEEYFLVAVLAEATVGSQTANRVLDRLSEDHSSGRRKRTGLAISLLDKVRHIDVHSPSGIYLGRASGVELDTERANRVLEKILRGLYFHQLGTALPIDARVFVEIKPDLTRLRSPVIAAALSQPPHALGDVFTYRVFRLPEGRHTTAWALGFYDTVLAIGVTGPPAMTSDEGQTRV
jgi:hypothetical protein